MKNIDLTGCGTALITPFRNGEVDYDAFAALVDRQVAAGIDFLVPLGTTGETPCLEDDERIKVLQTAKEHGGDLPILVGGGTNSLKHTVRSMQMLDPHGVDAFLIVVPYYNKPTQEGQYQYFKAVAESTDKPIVLYNVPGRTGANMTAETTLRLAEIDNIVAVKEASGNRAQIEEIRGVGSDHAVAKLVEKHLICEVGKGDTPGRPVLFGTSNEFLRYFGFKSIGELPPLEEEVDAENGAELTV